MARYVTEEILETECIGDSLTKINTNFEDLDTVFKTLSTEGASVTTSSTAPSGPSEGDLWFNGDTGILYVYFNDGNSSQWIEIGGGGGTSVTVSSTAPSSPSLGDLWFDDDNGILSVYYDSTWVGVGGGGGSLTVQDSSTIDLSYNTSTQTLEAVVKDASVTNAKIAFDGGSFAFRNKIINGNFDIWQRGTSLASGTGGRYLADRFTNGSAGTTCTASRVAFTHGQTAVPNEPEYYISTAVTSVAGASNNATLHQHIESVKSCAGKTVTLSFYAKSNASRNIAVELYQNFGTGGTPSTSVSIPAGLVALTTSWQKFTVTVNVPSISGKTLGTDGNDSLVAYFWFDAGSDNSSRASSLGQQSGTFDIAQVQLEEGPVATPFEQRPIGTELALCQRYYCKSYEQNIASGTASINNGTPNVICSTIDTTLFPCNVSFPATMRTQPSISIYRPSTGALGVIENAVEASPLAVNTIEAGSNGIGLITTSAVGQGGQTYQFHYTASAEL